jgi:hypothetical protein
MRIALVVVATLALTGCALVATAEPPAATATAQQGSFKLVARALLHTTGPTGELKATWLDDKQRCDVERKLRVSYRVDLVSPAAGTTRRAPAAKTGLVQNCSEGGPNYGFDVEAGTLGMACESGSWKPGYYSIEVRAVDVQSGLSVATFLYRQVTERC